MIYLKNNTCQASSTKITVTLKMKLINQNFMNHLYRNKKGQIQKELEITLVKIVKKDPINKAKEPVYLMILIIMTLKSIQIFCK